MRQEIPIADRNTLGCQDLSSSHGSKSSTLIGAIIGASVGGVAGLAIIALIAFCVVRRKKKNGEVETNNELHEKPEMYAGPANPDIASPVKPNHELRTKGTVQPKLLPSEKYSTSIEGLASNERSSISYPTSHKELAAERESLDTSSSMPQKSSQTAHSSPSATTQASSSTRVLVAPTSRPESSPVDISSAAEADLTVQELGLITGRTRLLTEQARTLGKRPEEVGRKTREQYLVAVEREAKLRALLEDMMNRET